MPKPRLMGIFGRNLLDDPEQVPGYDALLEYQDHKPFECVGEGRESRAAMAALARRPEWKEDAIVKRFARSEEHTSELQSLMRISYAVFCLKKKNTKNEEH